LEQEASYTEVQEDDYGERGRIEVEFATATATISLCGSLVIVELGYRLTQEYPIKSRPTRFMQNKGLTVSAKFAT